MLDGAGALVVEYKYDAWGRKLSVTGTLAATLGVRNPFRYRGYVYDEETGLYYLRSRYYSAERGRFVNADDTMHLAATNSLTNGNVFAFCNNDPVFGYDPDGAFNWKKAFAIGVACIVVGLAVLASVPTGGASLAVAGVAVSAATATAVGEATVITGLAVTTASVMYASSDNYSGKSTYKKGGNRVDYEYYGNGNGNVHIHTGKTKTVIWKMVKSVGEYAKVSGAAKKSMGISGVIDGITRAIDILRGLAGKR